jgi:hypothetical protein
LREPAKGFVHRFCRTSELHDRQTGDQPEVPYVNSQHGVANFQRRCSDQQIAERNDDSSALLLSVDLARQQRSVFGVSSSRMNESRRAEWATVTRDV